MKDKKKLSVIKSGSLYFIGNIFNKAIGFITIPVFTRILTTEEYGIVNTYASWITIFAVIVGLSLGLSIRNVYVDMPKELDNYISSTYALAFVNFLLIFLLLQLVLFRINLSRTLVTLCLVESFGNFAINAIIYRYVLEEKVLKRVTLLVLPNLISAVMSILLILQMDREKYYGRIISTCICTAVFGFGIILFYWIKYKTFIDKKYWRYAISISLPLVLNGLSVNILNTSDRTIITYFKGASETAVYSLAYSIGWVSNVVTTSAESIWIPSFTKALIIEDYKKVNRGIQIYIYVVLFAFCGLLTVAPELILCMGGKEYISGVDLIVLLIASLFVMFVYGIYVAEELFYKKTKTVAESTIIAALTNLVLNFIFIPAYGAMAAAITTFFSYVISFLLHHRAARKINFQILPDKLLRFPVFVFTVSCVITYLFRYHILLRWGMMLILGAVFGIYILCFFKKYNF